LTEVKRGIFSGGMIMPGNRRYWLMKSEPGCFSFDDLRLCPEGKVHWDGVRNYEARNLLRDEVKAGDGVLFYHSNVPEPSVVGLAEVVREGYPDFTALDPQGDHFDSRATEENPIWYMVDVRYLAPLERTLSRKELKAHPHLAGMMLLKKGVRLSVQPVSGQQWRAVLELAGSADPFADQGWQRSEPSKSRRKGREK
jgi:predicted RNA-binding protein with PUA-like domain